jgi:hypothetical protein
LASWSTWHSCFADASNTVVITGQPIAGPGPAYAPERTGDSELTGAKDELRQRVVAPARTTALAGEGKAVGITSASVVGVEMHTHVTSAFARAGWTS